MYWEDLKEFIRKNKIAFFFIFISILGYAGFMACKIIEMIYTLWK